MYGPYGNHGKKRGSGNNFPATFSLCLLRKDRGEEAPSASLIIATTTSRSHTSSMSPMVITSSPHRQTPRRSSTAFRSPCSACGCERSSKTERIYYPAAGYDPKSLREKRFYRSYLPIVSFPSGQQKGRDPVAPPLSLTECKPPLADDPPR